MVSVRSKKVQKLTYTQRVLSALSHIQKDSRKHAIHLATIRAQVRKHADARKDKLGPQWAHFVTKAVHKLEDDGILQRVDGGPTGQVSFTPGGRKSISSVRRAIPHTESTEDVLWKYVTPIAADAASPATTTSQLPSTPHGAATQPQRDYTTPTRKRRRPSGSPLKRVTRPRFSTISTHVYPPEDDDMDSNTDAQTDTPTAAISKGGRKSVRLSIHGAHIQRYDEDMDGEDGDNRDAMATTKPKKAISKMSKPELKAELLRMRRVSLGLQKENQQLSVRLRGTDIESEEEGDGMDIVPGTDASDPFERALSPLTDIDDGSPPPSPPPMTQDDDRVPTRPSTPTQQLTTPTIHLPSPSQTSLASSASPETQQDAVTPSRNANQGPQLNDAPTRTQSGSLISHISRRPTPAPSNPSSPTYPTAPLAPSHEAEQRHSGGGDSSTALEVEKLEATITSLEAQRDRVSATNTRLEEQLLVLQTMYPRKMDELQEELLGRVEELRVAGAGKRELQDQLLKKDAEVQSLGHDLEAARADLSTARIVLAEETAKFQGEKASLQKNIEELLSAKTALLEEAEGNKNANAQLVEATERLKAANQDLEARIALIEEQVVQGEIQSTQLVEEKAQVHLRLEEVMSKNRKAEATVTELRNTAIEIEVERDAMRSQVDASNRELEAAKVQLLTVQGDLVKRMEEIGRLQEDSNSKTDALVKKDQELTTKDVELATNAVTLEANSSEIAHLRSQLADAQHEQETSMEQRIQHETQIQDLLHQLHEKNGLLEATQKEVELLRAQVSTANTEIHQLNELFGGTNSSLTSAQQALASVREELEGALVERGTMSAEIMRLNTELAAIRQEQDVLQTTSCSQAVALEAALEDLEDERKKSKALAEDHAELQKLKEGDEATIRGLNQRTTRLKELVEEFKKGQAKVWGNFVDALSDFEPCQASPSGIDVSSGSSFPSVPVNAPLSSPIR
ncbi:hypothetical protein PC9H_007039 [Pleurotus ostreatus]|uniref:Uncharacterized protein n=1 Tax=Pleurotus ostreatus TaxID=5322 RepID=A0A8H6ZU58_PLEOS|nr:uncharacterized protein PC9H_007039 [Pleurotus ostreatus]KAF7427823.1 hypothetical protein PC9H_007039 [Pleurotus ostreatus]KAJ8695814.1 hypothetical protein PTI98_005737 [Pleurotus ostreatus]